MFQRLPEGLPIYSAITNLINHQLQLSGTVLAFTQTYTVAARAVGSGIVVVIFSWKTLTHYQSAFLLVGRW